MAETQVRTAPRLYLCATSCSWCKRERREASIYRFANNLNEKFCRSGIDGPYFRIVHQNHFLENALRVCLNLKWTRLIPNHIIRTKRSTATSQSSTFQHVRINPTNQRAISRAILPPNSAHLGQSRAAAWRASNHRCRRSDPAAPEQGTSDPLNHFVYLICACS